MSLVLAEASSAPARHILENSVAAPVSIPPGHVGEFVIPGTGRRVWWTGRVAIGLMYRPERYREPVARSALWVQELMLGRAGRHRLPQA
jgi:hypothetical protein